MTHRCRSCEAPLTEVMADLGMSPLANRFLRADQLEQMEPFWPLRAMVCSTCFLVQLDEFEEPSAIFSDYVYFSSWSTSWVEHGRAYAERMVRDLELGPASQVVEIASNDGYLLQHFVAAGIPVLGVEPAANVAEVAVARGVPTVVRFFGAAAGADLHDDRAADLLVANNVLAHVPDIHDFVEGFRQLLALSGLATFEFPHLLRLMEDVQFDTIYHEHFSYLSLHVVQRVLGEHGLTVVDVEELSTHGGSLRVHAAHRGGPRDRPTAAVERVIAAEASAGLQQIETYRRFEDAVRREKQAILRLLLAELEQGRRVTAYGAAAKGNTLLNYCGIGPDMIEVVADASTAKQGLYLPGTHIPVVSPDELRALAPDTVMVLPWNLRDEIVASLSDLRDRRTRFLVRAPILQVWS